MEMETDWTFSQRRHANGQHIHEWQIYKFYSHYKKQYEDPAKVKNRNYHINPESHIWVYIQMKTIF